MIFGAAAALTMGGAALAQDTGNYPKPDPTHIPYTLLKDIPWKGNPERSQTYTLFGDPAKLGPYAQLLKWNPGAFSKPHMHAKDRFITVVQGVWWVSSSNVYDPNKTYPLPAGTVVTDVANTVHWDGAKTEPAIILITGEGPAGNVSVDENGKPVAGDH
jgi:quercetin dioxygenase-like cupin family protein